MKEFEQDKDFQEVHEKYQAEAKEQPPQSLDASILQAAHLAVENSTADKHAQIPSGIDTQSVKRAWYVPVSYVAMLVISLSVVMKLALEPEMSPMMDDERFDMPEADSMLMEQEESAPLITRVEPPPVKRKLAKSAPAREKSDQPGNEDISQQRLNERKQRQRQILKEEQVSRAKVSSETLYKDKVFKQQSLSEDSYREEKRSKANSGQMLSSSQVDDIKAEPAALAPLVASSVEPSEEISMGANSGLSYMSGLKAEKPLSDELSRVNTMKKNKHKEITLKQQSEVKKIVDLYEKKQYKELKLALQNYRKDYPAGEKTEALPEAVLDWEKENMIPSPRK